MKDLSSSFRYSNRLGCWASSICSSSLACSIIIFPFPHGVSDHSIIWTISISLSLSLQKMKRGLRCWFKPPRNIRKRKTCTMEVKSQKGALKRISAKVGKKGCEKTFCRSVSLFKSVLCFGVLALEIVLSSLMLYWGKILFTEPP